MKEMMKMKKSNLMLVAGVVWMLAGVNVAVLGLRAATDMNDAAALVAFALIVGVAVTFLAFHMMFSKLVIKNSHRIRSLEGDKHNPLRFFDVRGYVIMALMMSMGMGMRMAGIFPDWFVAFFYTGLGLALALAGVSFLMHRAQGEGWLFHARRG